MEVLKIAVLEPFLSDYMDTPDLLHFLGSESDPVATEGKTYHGMKVYKTIIQTIEELAPEYLDRIDIELYPNVVTGLKHSRSRGCKILNLSNAYIRYRGTDLLEIEQDVAKDMLMICAAGNEGNEGETEVALRGDHWLTVGATDAEGNPKYYTSWGKGAVDVCGVSGQYGWEGTSFSAPYATALCAIYYIKYFDAYGKWPSPVLGRTWAISVTEDIWYHKSLSGYDLRTGYGLMKLPEKWNLKVRTPDNDRYIMRKEGMGPVSVDVNYKEQIKVLEDKGFKWSRTIKKGD